MSNVCNKIEIHFLGNGFLNYSKSLLIIANNDRYLINCGEGTQKLFCENGKKINSLKNIFFTGKSPKHMCGLIGLALGMAEGNNFGWNLHDFEEGIDMVKLPKKMMGEAGCKIKYNNEATFQDKLLGVTKFKYSSSIGDKHDCVGLLFSSVKMRPKLDVEKCKNMGFSSHVLKSSKMAQFFKEPFVTIDGVTINSKDVLIEPPTPERFLVVDCPSVDHINGMSAVLPFDHFNNSDGILRLVVHLTDKDIFHNTQYQSFIKSINSRFELDQQPLHIVVDSNCPMPPSFSSYYLQTCLNKLFDADVFPKLQMYENYLSTIDQNCRQTNLAVESVTFDQSSYQLIYSEPFMQCSLNDTRNNKMFGNDMWSKMKNLSEKTVIDEIIYENGMIVPELMIEKMAELKQSLDFTKKSLGELSNEDYPYITFIGTSSCTPSKYRNISCILIQPYADIFVIFDFGENSLDRIITMYGVEEANKLIRNLQMICISHDHLDHHSGLYTLLRYREMIGDCKRCVVLGPENVLRFTEEMELIFSTSHCSYNCDWFFIDHMEMEHNHFAVEGYPRTILSEYEKKLNLTLTPVRVFHTKTSYGFVLSGHKSLSMETWKITYSGDRTTKYDGLIREGMNSDILIHEATMDDGLEEMALRKNHSTITQAIEEGIKMNAKFTMLTHFSSRYPLVPPVKDEHNNVAQAFDFMRINLHSCKYLKILDHYLQFIFPSHWVMLMNDREKALLEKDEVPKKKKKINN